MVKPRGPIIKGDVSAVHMINIRPIVAYRYSNRV